MTSPSSPFPSSAPLPSGARDLALAARRDVDEAVAGARRSLAVAWESPAADRFRDDVAALLVGLDSDLRLLDDAAAVLAR
ncbi:hypothetical protein [Krasilnikoviella flava]|uniref:Uncharacterized protein n=1 Tax=Krasilnikoviella flava TaxID=526729 RepID=A0A1T5LY85_9MICO|nr:hypothetical protein [Krasilnikoviella flava]SKC80815.1 hypothetical protein SAMN04324258_4097 [Krasilnikoviella flava]